jgi:predicted adenine nucleotide alpha hydrolase (AANH) superfamily ATPase
MVRLGEGIIKYITDDKVMMVMYFAEVKVEGEFEGERRGVEEWRRCSVFNNKFCDSDAELLQEWRQCKD